MTAYIVRRLFYAIPILIGVNLITFTLFFIVNTPEDMANGPDRQRVIDAMVDILRHDAPWIFAYHPLSYGLRHAWVGNVKPNLMAINTLKYRRVEPALRVAYQKQWNQPVWWPLGLLLAFVAAAVIPAAVAYRRRLAASARQRS